MPLYEYQCETCHHQFEVRQKISDPVIDKCIQCGHAVRKLISASGIMFKGTGWYVTDYSNKMKDPSQDKMKDPGQAKQSESQAKDGAGSGSEKTPAKSESGSTPDTSSSTPTSPPSSPAPSNSGSSSDSTT